MGGTVDPKQIVKRGYDQLGDRYRQWAHERNPGEVRRWFLGEILARVPLDADVLELGCGPGVDASVLSNGRRYIGVDLSERQLEIARARLPAPTFRLGDFTLIELPPSSFDSVVSLYVLNHVPPEETGSLYRKVFGWLRPGGVLCASTSAGAARYQDVEKDWLGAVPMFFAGITLEEEDRLLRECGFEIELSELKSEIEDGEGEVEFRWMIARRPGGRP